MEWGNGVGEWGGGRVFYDVENGGRRNFATEGAEFRGGGRGTPEGTEYEEGGGGEME